MQVEFRNIYGLDLAETSAILNRCFAGYFFPAHFDRPSLAKMIRVDSVDLAASIIAEREGEPVGVALVARRGWNSRLAAMAIDPDARGQRVGTAFADHLVHAARLRGDRSFELEVIEQNAPALRLYEQAGFTRVRRLVGYAAESIAAATEPALTEVDLVEAAMSVSRWGVESLPCQISPPALTALGPPHRAFRLGPASAIMSHPAVGSVTLCALVVEPGARRQGWATRLLQGLSAQFSGMKWRLPILIPEEIPKAFFTRLGFRKESLTQIQMTRTL